MLAFVLQVAGLFLFGALVGGWSVALYYRARIEDAIDAVRVEERDRAYRIWNESNVRAKALAQKNQLLAEEIKQALDKG